VADGWWLVALMANGQYAIGIRTTNNNNNHNQQPTTNNQQPIKRENRRGFQLKRQGKQQTATPAVALERRKIEPQQWG
jgi:hypothetical protein